MKRIPIIFLFFFCVSSMAQDIAVEVSPKLLQLFNIQGDMVCPIDKKGKQLDASCISKEEFSRKYSKKRIFIYRGSGGK